MPLKIVKSSLIKHFKSCTLAFLFTFQFIVGLSQTTNPILERKIDISFEDVTCAEALNRLQEIAGIKISFNNDHLPSDRISEVFNNSPIKDIIKSLLQDSPIQVLEKKGRIILKKIEKELSDIEKPKRKYTISGFLKDSESGEELIGGTLSILQLGGGTYTNAYGFFSLTLFEGTYDIEFNYLGYETQKRTVELNKNQNLEVNLVLIENQLSEVVIEGSKYMGGGSLSKENENFEINELDNFPGILGEQDLIRTLNLLPGVQNVGGGAGGFSVRGGNADQNLILLDEAPVYYPSHFGGVFSIFNADAIKNVRLTKSGIPTEYHGRLSSVLDIRMKEGNREKFGFSGGIGLLMAKAMIEGPVFKGNGSYMLAARRTYPDLLIKAAANDLNRSDGLFFHDINGKMNWDMGKKSRMYLSVYAGQDVFRFGENFQINWGNTTTTLRWNHLYNDKLFSNTSLIISDFKLESSTDIGELVDEDQVSNFVLKNRINDFNLKSNFHFFYSPDLDIKFGGNLIYHSFVPGELFNNDTEEIVSGTSSRFASEIGAFGEVNWKISPKWTLRSGLHASFFAYLGNDETIFDYNEAGEIIEEKFYEKGEVVQTYAGLEPRILAINTLNNHSEWSYSYNHTIQYLQFLPSAFVNNPASVWLPSSNNIKPQRAHQLNIGYHHKFWKNKLKASIQTFGIFRNKQIAYRNGADYTFQTDLESNLVFGKSWSYGLEVLLKKSGGRFRGWLGYSLSQTKDQFKLINDNQTYRSVNDRPHNLSLVALFDPTDHCTLAASWIFNSGRIATVPAGKYEINGQSIDYYGDRNNYRMSNHKRLDLSINWRKTGKRGFKKQWSLSVYNMLGNKNSEYLYIDPDSSEAIEWTLLGWIPSFSFSFEY